MDDEETPLESNVLTNSLENAQKKVEGIGKKHGMVRKSGAQDVSKLTNTYKTT